jgi:hypothetical protein
LFVCLFVSGLKLLIILPQPPKCWDYRCVPPCPVSCLFSYLSSTPLILIMMSVRVLFTCVLQHKSYLWFVICISHLTQSRLSLPPHAICDLYLTQSRLSLPPHARKL